MNHKTLLDPRIAALSLSTQKGWVPDKQDYLTGDFGDGHVIYRVRKNGLLMAIYMQPWKNGNKLNLSLFRPVGTATGDAYVNLDFCDVTEPFTFSKVCDATESLLAYANYFSRADAGNTAPLGAPVAVPCAPSVPLVPRSGSLEKTQRISVDDSYIRVMGDKAMKPFEIQSALVSHGFPLYSESSITARLRRMRKRYNVVSIPPANPSETRVFTYKILRGA